MWPRWQESCAGRSKQNIKEVSLRDGLRFNRPEGTPFIARQPGPVQCCRIAGYGLPRRCAPRNDGFGGGCVGTELPNRFATAREGHDPPLRAPAGTLALSIKPTAPPSLSLRTSAHAGVAIRSPASRRLARPGRGAMGAGRLTGLTAGAMLRIAGERIATSLRSSQ